MALLTRAQIFVPPTSGSAALIKSAAANRNLLKEAQAAPDAEFDIFLSHSTRDAMEVYFLKKFIENLGYSVYVDWIEDDKDLDRDDVTPRTAARLRRRIQASRCLLVHASEGGRASRWVPWELGYADGHARPVGILPVLATGVVRDDFRGTEYLGLYPYIDFAPTEAGRSFLWANRSANTYVKFDLWLKGKQPYKR